MAYKPSAQDMARKFRLRDAARAEREADEMREAVAITELVEGWE